MPMSRAFVRSVQTRLPRVKQPQALGHVSPVARLSLSYRSVQLLHNLSAIKDDITGSPSTTAAPLQQNTSDVGAAKLKLSTKDALQLSRVDLKAEKAKNVALKQHMVALAAGSTVLQRDGRQVVYLDRVEQLLAAVEAKEREGAAMWKADMSKVLERAGEELREAKAALEGSRLALQDAQVAKQKETERCEKLAIHAEDLQEDMRIVRQSAANESKQYQQVTSQLGDVNTILSGRTPREILDLLEAKTASLEVVQEELDMQCAMLDEQSKIVMQLKVSKADVDKSLDEERSRAEAAEKLLGEKWHVIESMSGERDQLQVERDALLLKLDEAVKQAGLDTFSIKALQAQVDKLRAAQSKAGAQALADVASAREETARAVSGGAKMRELRQLAERDRDERIAAVEADSAVMLAQLQHELGKATIKDEALGARAQRDKEQVQAHVGHGAPTAGSAFRELKEAVAQHVAEHERLKVEVADNVRCKELVRAAVAEAASLKAQALAAEAQAAKLCEEAVDLRKRIDTASGGTGEFVPVGHLNSANAAIVDLQASLVQAQCERSKVQKDGEIAASAAAAALAATEEDGRDMRATIEMLEAAAQVASQQLQDCVPRASVAALEARWAAMADAACQERDEAIKRCKAVAGAAAADKAAAVAGAETARGELARSETQVAELKAEAARVKREREDAFVRGDLRATDLTLKLRKAEERAALAEQQAASLRGRLEGAEQTLALQDDVAVKLRQAVAQAQGNAQDLSNVRDELIAARRDLTQERLRWKVQSVHEDGDDRRALLADEMRAIGEAMMSGVLENVLDICSDGENSLQVHMRGPDGSSYASKVFSVLLVFSDDFPAVPPVAQFLVPIFHPNVDKYGVLLWSNTVLDPSGNGNGLDSGVTTIAAINTQLAQPHITGSPANREAARLFLNDPTLFHVRAQRGR